jgi:glycosyltransferase involved in cell wall biosynthesis
MEPLTVIITTCNDSPECIRTVESLRATAPPLPIVIVDDDSSRSRFAPLLEPLVEIVKMEHRAGVGPARTVGVMRARTPRILITDSHMRFTPGWYERAMTAMDTLGDNALACAVCLALDVANMNPAKARARYYGATINFHGPDKNLSHSRVMQTLEPVWQDEQPGDGASYEIPCVLGAAYFMARERFLHLQPLRFLRGWGVDELMLSLKNWLAGGSVHLLRNVAIGHKFRNGAAPPFPNPLWHSLYNKLFLTRTLLPEQRRNVLEFSLHSSGALNEARAALKADMHLVACERERNAMLFGTDAEWSARFNWFLDRFKLSFPKP